MTLQDWQKGITAEKLEGLKTHQSNAFCDMQVDLQNYSHSSVAHSGGGRVSAAGDSLLTSRTSFELTAQMQISSFCKNWCDMPVVRALKISQLTDGGTPPTYDSMH